MESELVLCALIGALVVPCVLRLRFGSDSVRVCKGESKSEIKTRAKKIIAVLGGIFNYKRGK